jgi:hypothetical protein
MSRSNTYCGFRRFQQIVAWLLLATFVPIAILSEGAHLLPGLGTCCQSSDHQQFLANHCHHQSEGDSPQQNSPHQHSDFIPVDGCVVCEFCSLFNSIDFDSGSSLFIEIVSEVENLEPVLFSGEFFLLFLVRAPPAEFC